MTDAPVRWGILATGGIATKFAEDLKLLPAAQIAAVGSRSAESAERFAAAYAIPRAHASWAALAADAEVDVIYVATPHSAHHEAARLCLDAGRAVLVEKPFTLDLATAEDLVGTARARGLFLMEAMWMRTIPGIRRMAGLIADGAIGEVTSVHADFGLPGPFPPEHRLRNPRLGGGALLDLGVYPVTFAHLVLGTPDRITARAALTAEGVDENTSMIMEYASGAHAVLHCGLVGDTPCRAAVVGTRGRIEVPRQFHRQEEFTLVRSGAEPELISEPVRGNGLGYEAEEVMACLHEGRTESELIPLSATLDIMRILDEARGQIGVEY